MSIPQRKRQAQKKLARLEIVSQLYKRGYSFRQIREECMKRLDLSTYSLTTVQNDVQTLLEEWRRYRIEEVDAALQLELERIDDTCRELWQQWEKSKEDWFRTTNVRKGAPKKRKDSNGKETVENTIETFGVEESRTNIIGLGDPRYISEIRVQLQERRKLLGLYAPEKKDISGDMSFASYLVESGIIDKAENEIASEGENGRK